MRGVGRIAAAILILVASYGVAAAADIRSRFEPVTPMYAVPIQSWTGFYLGVNGGGGFGSTDFGPLGPSRDNRDWLYGIQAGYLWQTGRLVLGVEADLDGSTLQSRTTSAVCPTGCDVSARFVSTVRGRAGMTVDRFLPYLTGGLAFGDMRVNNDFTGGSLASTQTGYALGGGLEFPLAGNWTARGEYLFVDVRDLNCVASVCGGANAGKVGYYTNMYRAAFNYRF